MASQKSIPGPRDPRLEIWRSFLVAHAQIRRQLERELQAEQSLGLGEYEVLLILARATDRQLRMSELADHLVLSRSGVTRLVDRLEADALVERTSCETDRRGSWATLTDAGQARLRRAAPTHLRGIGEHFLDRIPPAELDALQRTLDRVLAEPSLPGRSSLPAAPPPPPRAGS
jgi:DNA-binding MarR family transcriptional regulator